MRRIKMVATDGMMLTNGEIYGEVVYLGSGDSPDNWQEITREQARNRMEQEVCVNEEDLY